MLEPQAGRMPDFRMSGQRDQAYLGVIIALMRPGKVDEHLASLAQLVRA